MTPTERVRRWRQANPEKAKALDARNNKLPCKINARRRYRAKPEVKIKSREQNRVRMHSSKARASSRRAAGLPEPTRPEPSRCENCGGIPTGKPRKDHARVAFHCDHDHVTGEFRGWLCSKCNRGIGLLGDNLSGILQAVAYLLKPRG